MCSEMVTSDLWGGIGQPWLAPVTQTDCFAAQIAVLPGVF
jgi:hypothetical protein